MSAAVAHYHNERTLRARQSSREAQSRQLRRALANTFKKRQRVPQIVVTPPRPMIRMKDSDDYITARAANPRTGQISPSVSSTGPRTPDSPAAALKLSHHNLSPTKRPVMQYVRAANEGKRVRDKIAPAWLAGNGAFRDTSCCDLVLPTVTNTKPLRRQIVNAEIKNEPLCDDEFVVKMPSAREPQPYAYPGHTSSEIQAYEHYKRKTKRTSGEGYDRRLLVDTTGGMLDAQCDPRTRQHAMYQPVQEVMPTTSVQPLNIIKRRRVPSNDTALEVPVKGVTFASAIEEHEIPANIKVDPYRHYSAESVSTVLHNEQGRKTSSRLASAESIGGAAPDVAHLNQLPRVRLVHPSLASTPALQAISADERKCSFGCPRNASNNTCSGSRKTSQQSNAASVPLFLPKDDSAEDPDDAPPDLLEIILLAATMLWLSFKDFLISQIGAMNKLLPQNLTTWEKLLIARSAFCLLVRIVAVTIVATLMWKLTGIALQVVRLVFWPVDVILRIARWMSVWP